MPKQKMDKQQRDIIAAREEGHNEGYIEGVTEILRWLEDQYLNPKKRTPRTDERSKAILDVTRQVGRHLRKILKKKGVSLG